MGFLGSSRGSKRRRKEGFDLLLLPLEVLGRSLKYIREHQRFFQKRNATCLQLAVGCSVLQLIAHHRHPVRRTCINLCLHQSTLLQPHYHTSDLLNTSPTLRTAPMQFWEIRTPCNLQQHGKFAGSKYCSTAVLATARAGAPLLDTVTPHQERPGETKTL